MIWSGPATVDGHGTTEQLKSLAAELFLEKQVFRDLAQGLFLPSLRLVAATWPAQSQQLAIESCIINVLHSD